MDASEFETRACRILELQLPHRQFDRVIDAVAEFFSVCDAIALAAAAVPAAAEDEEPGAAWTFNDGDDEDTGDAHAPAMLIVGDSGTGKSRILKAIAARPDLKPSFGGRDADKRPFVLIDMPDPATPKEIMKAICTELRVPLKRDFTRGDAVRQLRNAIAGLGVRMFAFDEAHTLCEDQTAHQIKQNARFLKFLLVTIHVPLMLVGEGPLKRLLGYAAMERRIHSVANLAPYMWADADEAGEWMGLATGIETELGLGSALCADPEFAIRLYLDTGGVVGLAAKRLTQAGRIAVKTAAATLSVDHFTQAWQDGHREDGTVALDPFDIGDASANVCARNPYAASVPQLRELWRSRFHPAAKDLDTSRQTRRRGRTRKVTDSFVR